MQRPLLLALGLVVILNLTGSVPLRAADDFRPLFNGKDLSGWVPVNVAPRRSPARWDDRLDRQAHRSITDRPSI